MKIVINTNYGGFGLSHAAMLRYAELCNEKLYYRMDKHGYYEYSKIPFEEVQQLLRLKPIPWEQVYNFEYKRIDRSDPNLVRVVEELGVDANSEFSDLKIVDIPDGVQWHIEQHDGAESVVEDYRVWQ